jgi:hypothetical protein
LETAVPYSTGLHIDRSTKKLILNLVNSIRSVVPVAGPSVPTVQEAGRENEHSATPPHGDRETTSPAGGQGTASQPGGQEAASLDCIKQVLIKARKHSRELDGIFDPDILLRYVRYVSDYQDIIDKIEQVRQELEGCRDAALDYASGMAKLVEDHLLMTAASDSCSKHGHGPDSMHGECGGIKLEIV